MTTGRKALANPCAVPRYRGEFRARRLTLGARKLPAAILSLAVGITSCAAVAGSFTLEAGQPQQIAGNERMPRSIIETRFRIVAALPADSARQRSPPAAYACDDLAFRFLNTEKCSDARGKHMVQPRRAPAVIMAHSGPLSPDFDQSQACGTRLTNSLEHCRLD